MLLLGTALTVAAVMSTWIVVAPEHRVRLALHIWGDSISSLFSLSWRASQEQEATHFNNIESSQPNNCSICLFALGEDGSLVLVGQKLPHMNYSHTRLLLLPEDPRTFTIRSSLSNTIFRWYWRLPRTTSVVAIVEMIAIISYWLGPRSSHRCPVMDRIITADAASTVNGKASNLAIVLRVYHGRMETLSEWIAVLLRKGYQTLSVGWKNHSYDRPRNGEEEHDAAGVNKDGVFEADHERDVLAMEIEIERFLTEAALQQKRIAVMKAQDVVIEGLRTKLDFTMGRFREFQKEHERCRTRNVRHETK